MTNEELDVLFEIFGRKNVVVLDDTGGGVMNGKVLKVVAAKGFGFLKGEDGKEYFFHQSGFNGFFADLEADLDSGRTIEVTFEPNAKSPKGPRAENVARKDNGV